MSSAWDGLKNDPERTELPHYAFGKNLHDSYFTRRTVAKHCMTKFLDYCRQNDIDADSLTYIDPSCGAGAFYDNFPTKAVKIAVDICPQTADALKSDYLTWYPKVLEKKYVVAGNPPFGHRGAVALAFIKRSFLFADYVAFILPMSFYSNGKGSNMRRVMNATLVHSEPLGKNSFYESESNKNVSVNTVFQIWRKGEHEPVFPDYDVSEYASIHTCCSAPSRKCGLERGREYDCFITSTFYGNNIRPVASFDQVKYGSGYGIIAKRNKEQVLTVLAEKDWVSNSSPATNSCRHIRMWHIRKALGEAGFGKRVE